MNSRIYIRKEEKPTSNAEMIAGMKAFREMVTVEKCQKYIGHLKKRTSGE